MGCHTCPATRSGIVCMLWRTRRVEEVSEHTKRGGSGSRGWVCGVCYAEMVVVFDEKRVSGWTGSYRAGREAGIRGSRGGWLADA